MAPGKAHSPNSESGAEARAGEDFQDQARELQDRLAELRYFNAFETTAWVKDDLPESIRNFFNIVIKCLRFDDITLFVINPATRQFTHAVPEDLSVEAKRLFDEVALSGVFAFCLREDKFTVQPLPEHFRALQGGSVVVMPLVVLKKPVGVLVMRCAEDPAAVSNHALELLAVLTKHYAIYLAKLQKVSRLEKDLALAMTEKHYMDNVVNSFVEAMFATGIGGELVLINHTAELIFGMREKDVIGKNLADVFSPSMNETFGYLRVSAEKGDPLIDYEVHIKSGPADGFTLGSTCTQIRDPRGDIMGFVYLFRDMFSAKEVQRLKRSDQSKALKIAEARRNIGLVRRQLVQADKLASIGHMAAGIAHEINNPLGIISGYLQIMMMDIPEEEQEKYYLKTIHGELHRIKKIVRNLLDFSRQQNQSVEELFHVIDIVPLLRETLELMGHQLKINHVQVATEFDESLPGTLAVSDQLKQVCMNLLINSIQAMEGRENRIIRISARLGEFTADDEAFLKAQPRKPGDEEGMPTAKNTETGHDEMLALRTLESLRDSLKPGDSMIVLRFTDSGEGIRNEHLPRIFDPFFTTKKTGLGTGLGLSTTYGIIQNHGGFVRVESEWGKGATFEIKLRPVKSES